MNVSKQDSIIISDAYRLSSPFMKDSILSDFYDIKRFVLAPGEYRFNLTLQDLNSDKAPLKATQNILIEDMSKAISISDIQVNEYATQSDKQNQFYKSGYELIPRLATFYPKELSSIPVYFEIYNSLLLEDSVFAIKQTLINALNNKEVEKMTQYSKLNTAEVVPFLKSVDITDITTGKYILQFTLVNKNMIELGSQSYEFDRSNDVDYEYFEDQLVLNPEFQKSISDDSIGYYLECLIPISEGSEVRNILKLTKSKNAESARKYIQLYWLRTAPDNTYENWIKYKIQVQKVEEYFGDTFKHGFETDRGRIYLKYGPATNINRNESSSSEYPYEIWQYNRIGAFNNKKFIFYNPNMTNNSYELLHSDMIGELKNLNWPGALSKRGSGTSDGHGANSRDMFNE